MKVSLSEKGGMPNGVRNFMQAVLFVAGGACAQAGYWWWFVTLMMAGTALFGVNVVHYFKDNYLRGYQDGHEEGLLARGLPAPEANMIEGAYRVLASTQLGDSWMVLLEDAHLEGREPRLYKMKVLPPSTFRKERWADPNNADPGAFVPGYAQMKETV
ncbi:MAG: hypothetical protein Q7S83_02735 [bacterium]|nr:hypothetical protein [bacterium]